MAGRRTRAPTWFVVVHLSSIDSFEWYLTHAFGESVARTMCQGLLDGISQRAAAGPTVIMDQGWDGTWAEKARKQLADRAPDAIWVRHDEDTDGWSGLRRSLPRLLRDHGAKEVELGGFWLEGCVSQVERILKAAKFRVRVNAALSGAEASCGLR